MNINKALKQLEHEKQLKKKLKQTILKLRNKWLTYTQIAVAAWTTSSRISEFMKWKTMRITTIQTFLDNLIK